MLIPPNFCMIFTVKTVKLFQTFVHKLVYKLNYSTEYCIELLCILISLHYNPYFRFFKVATFCFDDSFAHSWYNLNQREKTVNEKCVQTLDWYYTWPTNAFQIRHGPFDVEKSSQAELWYTKETSFLTTQDKLLLQVLTNI